MKFKDFLWMILLVNSIFGSIAIWLMIMEKIIK